VGGGKLFSPTPLHSRRGFTPPGGSCSPSQEGFFLMAHHGGAWWLPPGAPSHQLTSVGCPLVGNEIFPITRLSRASPRATVPSIDPRRMHARGNYIFSTPRRFPSPPRALPPPSNGSGWTPARRECLPSAIPLPDSHSGYPGHPPFFRYPYK
jgi:hypothetical protein